MKIPVYFRFSTYYKRKALKRLLQTHAKKRLLQTQGAKAPTNARR
jgi:hypothetical protein